MQCERIKKFGPWGSQCPTNWSMQAGECETFKEITISHGFIVDGIGFSVADRCGNISTTWFGGKGGNTSKIPLKCNEYITQISGTHGVYKFDCQRHIASIKIHTNLCPTGYGPFGLAKDTSKICCFSSPVPNCMNYKITGFFGRSGRYMDSIGIYMDEGN